MIKSKNLFQIFFILLVLIIVGTFIMNILINHKLYASPSLFQIAAHWSPFIYQGTINNYDLITNFNFDGNWNGYDNWENAGKNQYYTNFHAYVYYTIIESDSHYFITYMFFHPRDTGNPWGLGLYGWAHENDSEGCRVVIEKDGSNWGRIQNIETIAHESYYIYNNPSLINSSHPAVYVCERKHAVYGTNKAKSYDCWYLTGCKIFLVQRELVLDIGMLEEEQKSLQV